MNWFYDLKIRTKLLGSFILLALTTAIVGYVGTSNVSRLNEDDKSLYKSKTVPIGQLVDVAAAFQKLRVNVRDNIMASTEQDHQKYAEQAKSLTKDLLTQSDEFQKAIITDDLRNVYRTYQEDLAKYISARDQIIALASKGESKEATELLRSDAYVAPQNATQSDVDKMKDIKVDHAKTASDANNDRATYAMNLMDLVAGLAVLFAIVWGLWLSSKISKPVKLMAESARRLKEVSITNLGKASEAMAMGNLNVQVETGDGLLKITSQDELGLLAGSINGIIEQTQSTATSFAQALSIIRNVIEETTRLTVAAQEGRLSERGKTDQFQGGYRDLVQGFNGTLDAMTTPIADASDALQQIAGRDLSVRMQGSYRGDFAKIKDSLNQAVQNLDDAMSQVAVGAGQVAAAAGQISSGSQSLAQGASEQASSLEEISSSLQEMSSMSKQNTAHAKEARGLAERTRESAERGGQNMRRLSEAINKIKGSADATAKIVKTIDEIAFQTNLLALNAAVEAARAGDAGKGFAVVAEEVRNLAMRSAEAAKNTANLIEESVKNAEGGVSLNEEVLRNFGEIQEQAKKVNEVMAEIAAASDQQAEGVFQVSTAIEQMNQVTQQTASNAEESASTSEEMSGQSEEMLNLVTSFRLSRNAEQSDARHVVRRPVAAGSRPVTKRTNGHKMKLDPRKLIPFEEDDLRVLSDF